MIGSLTSVESFTCFTWPHPCEFARWALLINCVNFGFISFTALVYRLVLKNITVWRVSVHNVVRAIQLMYRKWQNSDPRSSETRQDIEMRFGVFDYVVEDSLPKKFGVAPTEG